MNRILQSIIAACGIISIVVFNYGAALANREGSKQSFAFEVTGRVTSRIDGEPLPGVNVTVKGTVTGTVTDIDGQYALNVPDENSVLVFSFVGYETQEVPVNGRSVINMTMEEDIGTLDEIVVVGYGTVRKSDLTGAVSSVKNEDLNVGAISSVDEALKGRIAGVQISQTSAEPGGGMSIRIRGASSINAGNEPLYVIDGLPINNEVMLQSGGAGYVSGNPNAKNPLSSLNPNDIASVEVLKDASATAIYGSRGANGVILITTKSGSKEKMQVNFDSYAGVQQAYKQVDVLSTEEYINTLNTLAQERGQPEVFSDADIAAIGGGTDWQDEIFRRAWVTNNNLSVSGGSENTSYFISGNYFNQQGIVEGSGMDKYSLRVNLDFNLSDKLTLGLNMNASLINDDNNVDGTGINETAGPINSALQYDPTLPPRQPDGTLTVSEQLSINNPAAIIDAVRSNTETNRTFGTIYLNYQILKDLSAKLNIGVDRHIARRDLYNARGTYWGGAGNGQADIRMLERYSELLEYTMTYNRNWSNINLNAVAGVSYEDFVNRSFNAGINDFPTDNLGTNNLALGNLDNASVGSNKNGNSLLSYLFRANLSLFDRFLVTSSIRADGSTRFGVNNKFGYFPSVALAWKLSEENFIPDTFSELKLRGSWGATGNQEIANYASLSTFQTGDLALLGDNSLRGTTPARIANPDLKWETTKQLNFGLDFGMLQGRISASVDYFHKKTEDLLLGLPIPRSTGFGSILSNVGSVKNEGIEVMINSVNLENNDFSWQTGLTFSSIKNEVTSIGSLEQFTIGNIFTSSIGIVKRGFPLGAYYTYQVTGIFQDDDEVANSAQPNSSPGNPIYLDANDDGSITADDDRVVVGSPWPDFTFGFRNTFSYKNVALDIFIDGQYGADLLNANAVESLFPVNERRNRLANQIEDRWTPDNPNAKWPSALNPPSYGPSKLSSLVIEDASFLRVQSIQLSYTFDFESAGFLSAARIYVTGQNPLMITKYTGYNPEANAFGRDNVRADYNPYPISKVWMLGVNLGF